MVKVSIICRTYNQEDIISDAISSALNQTFTDFELIIIDDNSTDKTSEKLQILLTQELKKLKILKISVHWEV